EGNSPESRPGSRAVDVGRLVDALRDTVESRQKDDRLSADQPQTHQDEDVPRARGEKEPALAGYVKELQHGVEESVRRVQDLNPGHRESDGRHNRGKVEDSSEYTNSANRLIEGKRQAERDDNLQ